MAVRLSSHPVARALAQAVGEPITSSSANISGNPAVVSVNQLDEELIASVMGILDEPPVPAEACPPHSSNAWKTAGSASSGQAPSPPRRSLKPGLRLWKKNEIGGGRGSLLKKGFPFPLPRRSTLSNPTWRLFRLRQVLLRIFLSQKQKRPGIISRPLLFLFHFLPGDACQAPAFRAALHTVYPYESFRGEGMGFGEGEGPLFQKGPLPFPNLPSLSSLTMQAQPDRSRGTRRCRHQRARRLDAGAADVNHTVDFGSLKPRPPGVAGRATPDGAHPRG